MKSFFTIILILSFLTPSLLMAQEKLPNVYQNPQADRIAINLRALAEKESARFHIPEGAEGLPRYTHTIRDEVIKKSGALLHQDLALNYQETHYIQQAGYSIRTISFQTRPGIYATANLYVPDGEGVFPAVINTHGHWDNGRRSELFQSVAHNLASNGYVCLNIDAWGAGERTTQHEEHEYHGSNLGAALMNIGESLLGMQLTDNTRGVDLLASLPYVDPNNLGATGASGGGNQAMWLAALDTRIKAVVPVVSVGTFQSYIMNSNCVCELMPDGLTFTEEAGILSLIAPRALTIMNATKDSNPSFFVAQMLKSFHQVQPVYQQMNASEKVSYQLFDTGHGYWPEMQEAMIKSFNTFLKTKGRDEKPQNIPFKPIEPALLATYPKGERPKEVMTTVAFCRTKGKELHHELMHKIRIDKSIKINDLKNIVHADVNPIIMETEEFSSNQGWLRQVIKGNHLEEIPLLHYPPQGSNKQYTVLIHPGGKDSVSTALIDQLKRKGQGIILPDLWGTGENSSTEALKITGALPPFHTLARSAIWLGNTVLGKWVTDLTLVTDFLKNNYEAQDISIDGAKEAGLAALIFSTLTNNSASILLRDSPVSYQFDTREGVDHFNMAVHLPGILKWGDISLMAALSHSNVHFINPLTLSGRKLTQKEQVEKQLEFNQIRNRVSTNKNTEFSWIN